MPSSDRNSTSLKGRDSKAEAMQLDDCGPAMEQYVIVGILAVGLDQEMIA
jgi:hypothetical protein